jgi:uncharacterized protein (TIGR01777 family)
VHVKRIGVTGASGFIGQALVEQLLARGDQVVAFSRGLKQPASLRKASVQQLDVSVSSCIPALTAALEGLDAVVHLVGETVAGRWSHAKKQRIHDSRQFGTRNVVDAMRACQRPPRAFVCASALGYYGSRGDEPLTENSSPGNDFLAHVCVDWEREAVRAEELGIRTVRLRQGLVLGAGGGALNAMIPLFRAGVGGPLGSGAQWWPWIHIDDDVALMLFAVDREECCGALNAVSPDLTTNARFSQALGHALRRPSLAYAPGIALRVVLGEFAATLLSSQLMLPAKAEDLGFVWRHESLDQALLDILDPNSGRQPRISIFESSEVIAAELPQVFSFFSDPANLEALTPPALDFHILTPRPIEMHRGSIIDYRLRVRGLRWRWRTLVERWEPQTRFVDLQLKGPYLLWRHQHEFAPAQGGVTVRDRVEYTLPLAPLSDVALRTVAADLRRIFDYRRTRLRALV